MSAEALDSAVPVILKSLQLPGPWKIESLGNAGGFSGARLWRIESPAGPYCLKAWPGDRVSIERRAEIHRWMKRTQLVFVPSVWQSPAGVSCINLDDRVWDLVEWMPGHAVAPPKWSDVHSRSACRALAELHNCWQNCDMQPNVPESISRRWHAANEWLDAIRSGWQPDWSRCVLPDAVSILQELWALVRQLVPALPAILQPWRTKPQSAFPCLCDIWHAHVLWNSDQLTGIIDYGSMRIDTPAADLARLLGSLDADWNAGLAAYRQVRPFSTEEESLAHVLDRSGSVLAACSWLDWLIREYRPFENQSAVVLRLAALAENLREWRI